MDNLFIEGTTVTPQIDFQPSNGTFEIKGISMPEYADEFYKSILNFINEYIETTLNTETTLSFKFNYFNTGTSPAVEAVIKAFEQNTNPEHQIKVAWYYEEEDEDMKDLGEHYQNLTSLPFEIIPSDEIFYEPPLDEESQDV